MASIQDIEKQVAQDEEVVDLAILQKNGDPYMGDDGSPSTIGVLGSEAKKYRLARDEQTRKLIRGGKGKLTIEENYKARIDTAAAAVVRWHGWEEDGKTLPCSPEHIVKVLKHEHILVQVEMAIRDHTDFFLKSSET